jgi:hypothetical protein
MKTLLVGLVLVSTSSFAHETSYSSDSCNVDINGGVSISKSDIEFLKHDKSLYKIVNNSTLVIKGEEVPLTPNQQILVTQFSTDIRALIPQAKNVATDALSLASEGVSLVFNELLGENNAVVEDLSTHFNEINYEIEKSFSADQTIYFDEDGFSRNEFFGDDFEERIESAVEQTIQNSIGSLMVAVGQELLFSGGNMDAFEAKMENFEEQMEYEMELRGKDIEKRANALCDALIAIDRIEENMRNEISEVAKFDILTASAKNQNRT